MVIASSAMVPPGTKLYFLSGSTASPIDPAKPEEYVKSFKINKMA